MMKKGTQLNRAFTLIEMLIVVSIIGVLVSIVIYNLSSGKKKAQDASATSSLNDAGKLALLFYTDHAYAYGDGTNYACQRGHYYSTFVVPPNADREIGDLMIAAAKANRLPVFCTTSIYAYDRWQSFYAYIHLASDPENVYCVDGTGFAGKVPCHAATTPFESAPGNGIDQCGATSDPYTDYTCQ